MTIVRLAIHLPVDLWRALQAQVPREGDPISRILHLSARPAFAPRILNIRCGYELVRSARVDFFGLPRFGRNSLRKIKDKLAARGLTSGMTLEDDAYRTAVVATVAASSEAART